MHNPFALLDDQLPEALACFPLFLVAAFDDSLAPPGPFGRDSSAALAEAVANDLHKLLPQITELTVVLAGSLFDQTEVLQPGFPVGRALRDVYNGLVRSRDNQHQPGRLALGSDDGSPYTMPALNPRPVLVGPLALVPLALAGPDDAVRQASELLELHLLNRVAASAATADALGQAVRVRPSHLSYATTADLCALLRVQLEQQGFAGLWQLLEHALLDRSGVCRVSLNGGNAFLMTEKTVITAFYTFDDFTQIGPGAEYSEAFLAQGYIDWMRVQRQYVMTLESHGLQVLCVRGQAEMEQACAGASLRAARSALPFNGNVLVETTRHSDKPAHRLDIIEHRDNELGALAWTLSSLDADGACVAVEHFYPLHPEGIAAIIGMLRRRTEIEPAQWHRRSLHVASGTRTLQTSA